MDWIRLLIDYLLHLDRHLGEIVKWNVPGFYAVMFLVIFAETGLVVTPFLPGDSLLFLLGAMAVGDTAVLNFPILLALLVAAAVLGDAVNYHIGRYVGPRVFRYESSWLLNRKHLLRAQEFYEHYGSKTIILARFVPIVRTFAPFVAGVGTMTYRKFFLYNVVGGLAWVALCLGAGYQFGNIDRVRNNFGVVVIAIVIISVLPMVVEYFLARRRQRQAATKKAEVAQASDPAA